MMPGNQGIWGQTDSNQDTGQQAATRPDLPSAPAISLPKGGGAIRGIDEKFSVNPATGTGSLSVPIYTSPGRSGFGPQLSLSYDSGAGNGPFGLGWSLSLPAITRKTDRGLPQYRDAVGSDVFILSGAEDLVPVLVESGGQWQRENLPPRTVDGVEYRIQRYRPRIEGLFARIEHWTNLQSGETHWRSISRDNITTLYGKTAGSRIADPDDPARIFIWLICETYDDKGNAIVYEYVQENSDGVTLSQAHEKNRTDEIRSANRYLKRIKYGNKTSRLVQPDLSQMEWLFEVVLDYGEGHYVALGTDDEGRQFVLANLMLENGFHWPVRQDPFSSYRSGFEVRTYRLCRRVLMFHHFQELGITDCLVRSTEFTYRGSPVASLITGVIQSGYVRQPDQNHPNRYLTKSLPPLEFEYSQAPSPEELAQQPIQQVDADSLENLPYGLDDSNYRWVDLDGEGISGVLTEQAGAWYYKPNLGNGRFGPLETVAAIPSLAALGSGRPQLLDLAGDGQLDLVQFDGLMPGFYERTHDAQWHSFRPFESLPVADWGDPNLRFVDLTGDGHADVLVTEQGAFTWHLSLAEAGFDRAERVQQALDEEKGPRLLFADATQSIYLADLSGDGLVDLARIRNGEVCYWPNLGYGRFGAKVTMDDAPWFDTPDLFDQRRVRLADIDGSGTTDIIYLGHGTIDLYRNQAGNRWGPPDPLTHFPQVDNLSSVMAIDLLGKGTACLVWSSPLPGDAGRPMRYIDLMGGGKPYLLISVVNNLGAETHVHYAPSTQFYLADKLAGKTWSTRLPFPVHVVERVDTYDHISRNRFVTRYAYHHGHFDSIEREFQGFGLVEQRDTEEYATLEADGTLEDTTNWDEASHVPPVLTKTWFHTGAYVEEERISRQFAGEYYREGDPSLGEAGLSDAQLQAMLLDDTLLPASVLLPDGQRLAWDLSPKERREACRALKGSILRQEVYGQDGTEQTDRPYVVSEHNYAVELLQPEGPNSYAVFLAHPRETLDYQYERKLYDIDGQKRADPRVSHNVTLAVDAYDNVLRSVAIGYGRRYDNPDPVLTDQDREKQRCSLVTYTENRYTNPVDEDDAYRTPLPCETRNYELIKVVPAANQPHVTNLFRFPEMLDAVAAASDGQHDLPYEDVAAAEAVQNAPYRRLIEHVRTLYRPDDMGAAQGDSGALLSLCELQSLALPGETYELALTPGLLSDVYRRKRDNQSPEDLLPTPSNVLVGTSGDRGGYVDLDGDGHWWIPSGRVFYHPDPSATPQQEQNNARQHFFLPRRFADPFEQNTTVDYGHDLLPVSTEDAVGNTITALNDYRVLRPQLITDPNGNRSAVVFDALGLVAGTAVMGKENENLGDSLAAFDADLGRAQLDAFFADPKGQAADLLGTATTRIAYDVGSYYRTQDPSQPPYAATLAREQHMSGLQENQSTPIQVSFSYSNGFDREIQKKIQAEPGPVAEGGSDIDPRWVGSGWTVFNNKGKPVRQYEPFFTDTHCFEFDVRIGVSPVLFYDPVERVVATLHPNHTWEKVLSDPWRQETWDGSDTTLVADPKTDPDVGEFFRRLPDADYLPTWHAQRQGGALGPQEQDAARKAAMHADTPIVAHFDPLGRTFLTVAHNKFKHSDAPPADPPTDRLYCMRVLFDIEGNQREVIDAKDRVVMRYDYDMLGNRIHQASMEAGERWTLNDVAGQSIRSWDGRGHQFKTEYDPLRRPLRHFVRGTDVIHSDPRTLNRDVLFERIEYGEGQANDIALNLRNRVFKQYDGVGVVTSEAYDFKGNLLRSTRELVPDYKNIIDWAVVQPPGETFLSSTTYDALNRPLMLITPDNSVIRSTYNEANLLNAVEVNLRGERADGQPVWTPFVVDIDYDAKGQRTLIDYGNGVRTTYKYDSSTFRLVHLLARRDAMAFPDDCPQPPPADWPGCQVQSLHYTYDPVGNITHIRDDAQQTIYFRNRRVEPSAEYTYDAIYRLIEATGREHLGQNSGGNLLPPSPTSYNDRPRVRLPHPNDGNAMGTYLERYHYDEVGNFIKMIHRGSDPTHPGWTRAYTYDEDSQLESGKKSNRLTSTTVGTATESYSTNGDGYDPHGNMLHMAHLQVMQWDFKDQLCVTQRQTVNNEDEEESQRQGERTYYLYDAAGQRVCKVTELATGHVKDERIYLGGFEIYRRQGVNALVRETLHIMDDKQCIAMVETRTDTPTPAQLIRYQFGNHLGSASLELDCKAQIVSYEEHTPYGSTSYQAVRSHTETPKRYRYIGKERDEESGFYYHGARYCAPWLGRWSAADPKGIVESVNLYIFVQGNPVVYDDPNGGEARLIVDEQARTITIQTTVHLYATNARDRRRLGRAAQQARAFFQNPIVATDQQVNQARAQRKAIPNRGTTFTANNQAWTIRFDVNYQIHNQTTTPIRVARPNAQGQLTHAYDISRKGVQRAHIQVGDNVLILRTRQGSGTPGGNVQHLRIGTIESNAVGTVRASRNATMSQIRKRLIHETGHFLGFDDRYDPALAGLFGNTYPGFNFDIMGAGGGAASDPVVINPTHISEFGQFVMELRRQAGALPQGVTTRTFLLSGHFDDTQGGRLQPRNRGYGAAQSTRRQQRATAVLANTRAWQQAQRAPGGQNPMLFPHIPNNLLNYLP